MQPLTTFERSLTPKHKKAFLCISCQHLPMLLLFLFIALLACGCGAGTERSDTTAYEQITQEEAKEIMDTDETCIILDVRTHDEYDTGHIKNAICLPNEVITDEQPYDLPDLNQTILVYCRRGNRSKEAAQKLTDIGYTNIKEFGGIETWEYETE